MNLWSRVLGQRPIVTRLVLAVAGTMTAVLLVAGAFVYWRVEFALNRQLDQDLDAYHAVVTRDVAAAETPVAATPGQSYQVYDRRGRVIGGDSVRRLAGVGTVTRAADGVAVRGDVGSLLPPAHRPYRFVVSRVSSPTGTVVVASSISRQKHDEALRELLLQLLIADLATLAAASLVGYGVVRGALGPVEAYRLAAERADGETVLPVEEGRDDEVSRLGHTFNALLTRIRATNERERQLLADTSHELRSPLALMRAELEMALLRPRPPAEAKAALESLQGQVERLISLSNALLDLEEVRAGDVPAGAPIDPGQLLAGVADRYAAEAAACGRRIETGPGPRVVTNPGSSYGGEVVFEGNRHWLEVALGNLVSNALRYGAGTITLDAALTDDRVRLSVSDEGPGFAPDFVHAAFDRFSKAEQSRSSGGTGLGLSLVLAVAEAHGGSASISRSRVTLDLPAHQPDG